MNLFAEVWNKDVWSCNRARCVITVLSLYKEAGFLKSDEHNGTEKERIFLSLFSFCFLPFGTSRGFLELSFVVVPLLLLDIISLLKLLNL